MEVLVSGSFYGSLGHDALFYPEFVSPDTLGGIARHADDEQTGSTLATVSFRNVTLRSVFGTRKKGIPTGANTQLAIPQDGRSLRVQMTLRRSQR